MFPSYVALSFLISFENYFILNHSQEDCKSLENKQINCRDFDVTIMEIACEHYNYYISFLSNNYKPKYIKPFNYKDNSILVTQKLTHNSINEISCDTDIYNVISPYSWSHDLPKLKLRYVCSPTFMSCYVITCLKDCDKDDLTISIYVGNHLRISLDTLIKDTQSEIYKHFWQHSSEISAIILKFLDSEKDYELGVGIPDENIQVDLLMKVNYRNIGKIIYGFKISYNNGRFHHDDVLICSKDFPIFPMNLIISDLRCLIIEMQDNILHNKEYLEMLILKIQESEIVKILIYSDDDNTFEHKTNSKIMNMECKFYFTIIYGKEAVSTTKCIYEEQTIVTYNKFVSNYLTVDYNDITLLKFHSSLRLVNNANIISELITIKIS